MQKNNSAVLKSIFSPSYWKAANSEKGKVTVLAVTAVLISLQIVLSSFFIPVGENLRIYFSFITTAVASLIGGPIIGLCYGFVVDNLGFIIHPLGTYFPGYTISAMAAAFVYGLFFYRQKITIVRIFLAKFTCNLFINVFLGSVWSAMLMGKGYYYYFAKSIVKNLFMLPIEVIILAAVFQFVLPVLNTKGMIENGGQNKIKLW